MTAHRDLDPFTAEQLLAGVPVDAEFGPLADLLSAAASEGSAGELAGEATAVAAFRDAAGAARPVAIARSAASKALAIKVAVAITAVAGAGVAAAAATGNLPGRNNAQVAAGTARASASPVRSLVPSQTPSGAPTGSSSARNSVTPSHPTQTPGSARSASLFGLCEAYVAVRDTGRSQTPPATREPGRDGTPVPTAPDGHGSQEPGAHSSTEPRPGDNRTGGQDRTAPTTAPTAEHGGSQEAQLLELPAFRPLVRAAGDKAAVSSYCDQLLENGKPGGSAPQGIAPGSSAPMGVAPATRPSVTPSGRPAHGPTSSRPAATPTGSPTASPPPRGR